MDRTELLRSLDRYEDRHPAEVGTVDRFRRLVAEHDRCFHRDCFPGHITSSAWIVSRESGSILLTHHRKLERWLQLGGHADGDTDVLSSALREAAEESGLRDFVSLPQGEVGEILDLDIHEIPARGVEPAHLHHDIRFLLRVSEEQPIQRQETESKEIRWFPSDGIADWVDEESLLRMARKAAEWLARDPVGPR